MENVRINLQDFENMSGQKVNLDKSILYSSPNIPSNQRAELSDILGMRVLVKMGNYLGVPFIEGKNKTNSFGYFVNKFTNRMKGWSKHLLPSEGKIFS